MTSALSIHAAQALQSLEPEQLDFLRSLPKAELHAHLNGSIPLRVLQDLAENYTSSDPTKGADLISSGIDRLQRGVELNELNDFFSLFPAIYALTAPPEALKRVAAAVLEEFLKDQVTYIELRSTPKENSYMSRLQYVECVLDEVEKYGPDQAALIVSVDRGMSPEVAGECIDVAVQMKQQGRRVVGVDLCGAPTVSGIELRVVDATTISKFRREI
jgi:adenosine deaminase